MFIALRQHLVRTYLSVDPRSLALFRVLLGVVLLFELWHRVQVAEGFYSNQGLLPNHTVLWMPHAERMFSLFFMASSPTEARVGMALCALVYLGLLIGLRTRWMQVLALVCHTSACTRIGLLENGGDVVLQLLLTWTVFLPLGRRFSIDALRASLRARVEHDEGALAFSARPARGSSPVVSLAALAITLQLFAIYLFNVLHKTGATWMDGSAVHYLLHQDRIVTALGVAVREQAPPEILRALSYGTIGAEALGAALLIWPLWSTLTRAALIALLPLLHVGFALFLNLGVFPYAMLLFFPLLLDSRHWAFISSWGASGRPRLRCFFDSDCGVCFQAARWLARFDLWNRIEIVSNQRTDALPSGVTSELVEHTLVVQDLDDGRVSLRAEAVATLFRALPLGHPIWLGMRAPLLSTLCDRLYRIVADNRRELSMWLGLTACGIPSARGPVEVEVALASGPQRLVHTIAQALRELSVAALLLACTVELLTVDAAVPAALRVHQPDALNAIVDYGRLLQGFSLFAPDAPKQDVMLSIEATTASGRAVDPYNEVASRQRTPPFSAIPARLGNDQFFAAYSLAISEPRTKAYWNALEQWILRYPERTGDPGDRIMRFVAFSLRDDSPQPGKRSPTGFRKTAFLIYPRK